MPGKKLLVADDSLTIQKVIRLALSSEGYEIHTVSDGHQALQHISLARPDIVLIDVSLPGKTACEVKKDVNSQGDLQDVRFVLMSSAFEKVDEDQAEEARFHGRLTKPFDPAHLRQVLADVLTQTPESIQPEESTPIPPPQQEMVNELWEESDIQELTNSTMKMTGIDDFQWSINEPVLKPPARMMEVPEGLEAFDPPENPKLPNISGISDLTEISETFEPPKAKDSQFETEVAEGMGDSPLDTLPIEPPPPYAKEQIELLVQQQVRQQVEEALQGLIQKSLPEIAERLIKKEIHRMLSESP